MAWSWPSSACHSFNWEWARSTGKAEVYTFTIVYQALHPAFEPDVPYVAAIVALEEGPRIVSWVTDVRPEDVKIGMPLELWFDENAARIVAERQCLPDSIQPDAVARLVLFLASDDSAMCTSQNFVIDGGWL